MSRIWATTRLVRERQPIMSTCGGYIGGGYNTHTVPVTARFVTQDAVRNVA